MNTLFLLIYLFDSVQMNTLFLLVFQLAFCQYIHILDLNQSHQFQYAHGYQEFADQINYYINKTDIFLILFFCFCYITYFNNSLFQTCMDLIDDYQTKINTNSELDQQLHKLNNPYSVKQTDIQKIKFLLQAKLKEYLIYFQNEQMSYDSVSDEIQHNIEDQQSNNKTTENIKVEDSLKFHLIMKLNSLSKDVYITISINQNTSRVLFRSTILQNYSFLKIKSKHIIKQLCKHFLISNSKTKYGNMYIHPISGEIYHHYNNQVTAQKFSYLLKQPQKFYARILQLQIPLIKRHWQALLQKYLLLIDSESSNFFTLQPKKVSSQFGILQEYYKKIQFSFLNKIKFITQNCELDNQKFISNKDLKKFRQISSSEKNQKIHQIQLKKNRIKKQNLSENIDQIIKIFVAFKQTSTKQNKNIQNPQLQKHWIFQLSKHLSCQTLSGKNPLYSQIKVTKVQKQTLIFKSGFSQISLLDVLCKRLQDPQVNFNRIVKKKTKAQKFCNQQNVLKTIKDQKCLFISRYFYCEDIEHQQSILLEYCQERSLDYFIKTHQTFLSLSTKVYFIYQIILGLRFLRDFNIVHIDLKPQNVLVKIVGDKLKKYTTFIMKLIDFGESYSTAFKNRKQPRGFTTPYAPPQLIHQMNNRQLKLRFSQKADVFSLGTMMLQIMFENFPTTFNKMNKQQFSLNYMNLFSMPYEKCHYFGHTTVMSAIYLLCLKCISPQPNQRPTLDWLCIYFKQFLLYLENFYS